MASSLPTTIRDVITTAPIYAAFVHGSTDLTTPKRRQLPDNVYLFETSEPGEEILTTIDDTLWHVIQNRDIFQRGIFGEEDDLATYSVMRNIIMYRPREIYYERKINITADKRHDPNWGFFRHRPEDRPSYFFRLPYIPEQVDWLRKLKRFSIDQRFPPGTNVTTNTEYIDYVCRNHDMSSGPLIIFIHACSAIEGTAPLTPKQEDNLMEMETFQQTQLHRLAGIGIMLGFLAPSPGTVPRSRTPLHNTNSRGNNPMTGVFSRTSNNGSSHVRLNGRAARILATVGNNSGPANNLGSDNNLGLGPLLRGTGGTRRANTRIRCQKCMNYLGQKFGCGRKGKKEGGRRTRKFKRSRRN